MARYSVYSNPSGVGFLVDLQADLLSHFNTRVVAPLLPLDVAPKPASSLNPVVDIDGTQYAMVTQYLAAVPAPTLKRPLFSVEDHRDEITAALDLLFHGF